MPPTSQAQLLADLKRVIDEKWGYHTFRPLQEKAMLADLRGRDSLVVMPTGGGKSLCYQAPAIVRGAPHTTVVISPLIALMKDQVDGLRGLQDTAVTAIQIDSSQSAEEQRSYLRDIEDRQVRLVFISPERLVNTDFYKLLQKIGVRTFAIDEAHCISHWGHDFRPEYRLLSGIKERFSGASVHAYTATATEQVRRDIAKQLNLCDGYEEVLGNFDRPNLIYQVLPRHDRTKQVLQVLEDRRGEAGIIYCPFTRDVDDLTAILQQHGYGALRYHAKLSDDERRAAQDAFMAEECDLIVATVAFGMGIDRSNIRFVLHTAMPKSLEHYQQEAGRAGRDGLEAHCVLLHSGGDVMTWRSILEKNAEESGAGKEFLDGALQHLNEMDRFARGAVCRHRALVEYFGQTYEADSCGASCDVCRGDTAELDDAKVVAQQILSCVARVNQRFGIGYVTSVLRGEADDKVRSNGHDKLTTFGLLKDRRAPDIRDWIYQLISQKVLAQNEVTLSSGQKVPILGLTPSSWEVMRGEREVRLLQLVRRKKGEKAEKSKTEAVSWEGVDRELFEALRQLRQRLAQERQVPPYVIFGDRTLRELAQARPSSLEGMRSLYGIGEAKLRDYGETFLAALLDHCREHSLATDTAAAAARKPEPPPEPEPEPEAPPARDESKPLANALEVAQKILSCVARLKEPFPAGHVVRVLRGRDTERVRELGHHELSTFGLLRPYSRTQVHDWMAQLVEQKVLATERGAQPALRLNEGSWAVMRKQATVRLVPLAGEDGPDAAAWERVDRELFEALAELRDRLAEEGQVTARVVLGDWVLRELARVRPSSLERMRFVSGVGDAKLNAHGAQLLEVILAHCRGRGVPLDQPAGPPRSSAPTVRKTARAVEQHERAVALYRRGATVDEVMTELEWARATAVEHLCDFIRETRPRSIDRWVPQEVQQRVAAAARQVGTERLKPIYLLLGEKIAYEDIRVVVSQLLTASMRDS